MKHPAPQTYSALSELKKPILTQISGSSAQHFRLLRSKANAISKLHKKIDDIEEKI